MLYIYFYIIKCKSEAGKMELKYSEFLATFRERVTVTINTRL